MHLPNPMRVLHVIPSLDQRDGGPSVALPLMARSLAMQGIAVDVATTMSEADARSRGIRFNNPVKHEGYTALYFRRQTGFYKISLPFLRWLEDHIHDYALLHTHALFSFAPLAGARLARRNGVPYIMRPLGLLNTWGMENRRRWAKALSFRLLEGPALNHASAIHYTSQAEEREAARLKLRSKPAVVPLGIDLEPFRALPDKEVFLTRFPAARDRRLVLFLSRLDPKKGIEVLLDAMSKLRTRSVSTNPADELAEPLLVLAGDGSATYKDALKARISDLKLEDQVLWTGFLEGAERLAAFSAAQLFVLPSYSENFGIALVEAMAAGLPCIATTGVAAAKEMHMRDAGLVVEPGDACTLSRALQQLLDDPELRSRLGKKGMRLVTDAYSLSEMGTALKELYEASIKGEPTT